MKRNERINNPKSRCASAHCVRTRAPVENASVRLGGLKTHLQRAKTILANRALEKVHVSRASLYTVLVHTDSAVYWWWENSMVVVMAAHNATHSHWYSCVRHQHSPMSEALFHAKWYSTNAIPRRRRRRRQSVSKVIEYSHCGRRLPKGTMIPRPLLIVARLVLRRSSTRRMTVGLQVETRRRNYSAPVAY